MGAEAKVTTKGQITVPVEVRAALGIEAGDVVVFEVKGEYAVFTRRRSVLEITAGFGEQYPQLARGPVDPDHAVAEHFRRALAREESEERSGTEIFLVGPGISERIDTDGWPE